MGTNCAPLVTDLLLFCFERDFMASLSDDKQADIINDLNTTSIIFLNSTKLKKASSHAANFNTRNKLFNSESF